MVQGRQQQDVGGWPGWVCRSWGKATRWPQGSNRHQASVLANRGLGGMPRKKQRTSPCTLPAGLRPGTPLRRVCLHLPGAGVVSRGPGGPGAESLPRRVRRECLGGRRRRRRRRQASAARRRLREFLGLKGLLSGLGGGAWRETM
mgnify:CR=1 FL=1